ncbi:MAG: Phosphoesterase [Candidatus Bathyarchaeota archaeon B63]|nr:MAG: Phosphoesterase [Candidatus Bathyarchaeota archaeon B63]
MLRLLSPHAALSITHDSEKTLVISDLHIGWEMSLMEEGVHVPSQTGKLIERLRGIISSEKPDNLLILGDIKHAVAKIETEEWRDVPMFFDEVTRMVPKVQVVPGNHDGDIEALLPEDVTLLPPRGITIGDFGLFHGHTWPFLEMLSCRTLIIGHVHPVITFRDPIGFRITRQIWVKAPCNSGMLARAMLRGHGLRVRRDESPDEALSRLNIHIAVGNLIIMPSFNDFLGGQAVNTYGLVRQERFKGFIGPVLRSGSIAFENAEIYLLDGAYLGSLGRLREIMRAKANQS